MSEIPKPTSGFDETLVQFPQLVRARELFIALFQDRSPLVNLGYNSLQIEYVVPTLRLLEEEGKVLASSRKEEYLHFQNPHNWDEYVDLTILPDRQGFFLNADRHEFHNDLYNLSPVEILLKKEVADGSSLFKMLDYYGEVARIALFEDGSPIDDLDYLVPEVSYVVHSSSQGFKFNRENLFTKLASVVGLTTTYKAIWLDDQTKLEFAVEVTFPAEGFRPDRVYTVWRRLNPISDDQGTVTPFGQKANIFQQRVKESLQASQGKVVSRRLTFGEARE